jgi:hypothetical protein
VDAAQARLIEGVMMALRYARLGAMVREPLLHFLAIGAAIFGLYALTAEPETTATGDRIVVAGGDIARLSLLWEKRWQRPPTEDELRGLIDEHVREEVLYREALVLGLDRDDTVIRRHLRQKFEFLTQDLAIAHEPDPADLAAWFEANRERYRIPSRLSFTQVYFSLDRRGAAGEREARLALASLRDGASDADAAGLGDGTMLDDTYRDRTVQEMEALFGGEFAAALEGLEPGVWSGPIASGYGLHLVRIDARSPGEVPPFGEIEQQVRNDWDYEQRRQANEAIFQQLLTRYEVFVEGADAGTAGPRLGGAKP